MFKLFNIRPDIAIHFNNGPFLEITSNSKPMSVTMRDLDTDRVIHQAEISGNEWTHAHQCFYTNWVLEVHNKRGSRIYSHTFDTSGKTIRVNIDSRSLGDTLAWLPQISRFAKRHPSSAVYVSHFWKQLFDQSTYPELRFIDPETPLHDCYATYNIGFYLDKIDTHHPTDPRLQPLGKVAADILGIVHMETRPSLRFSESGAKLFPDNNKYVCIADASTAGCKLWQRENGWQTVVDHLNNRGYQVVSIQKEPTKLQRVVDRSGDCDILERVNQLKGCEFFIGLGSGLSWLAWALAKRVILISGFSKPYTEFEMGCHRMFNPDVCNGCWNDTAFVFDRDDWGWCPRHKGTDRQFECSKGISPEMVIKQIDALLAGHSVISNAG